ncbi:MAG TPA: hypothetical protein VMK12_01830 [Anaeromyxobacteraceae bacterium]|nr:hypothetical protein [Anaeromyxobacteraceae bacterium]
MHHSRMMILVCALTPVCAMAQPQASGQLHALHSQIAALQLDHALNLTQQQAQAMLPLLQSAQTKIQAAKTNWTSAQPGLVAALTQAVTDLKTTGTISASTVQAVQAARPARGGTLRQDLKSLWQQAKQLLTADQIQALKTVKLGVGHPEGDASDAGTSSDHGEAHRHFGRHFRLMHTVLSSDFESLVQARASPG